MKDNFSENSDDYKKFRPGYPTELIEFITNLLANRDRALDCGTGNGQIASQLVQSFKEVYGIDISTTQLEHTPGQYSIKYSVQAAEKTSFPPLFFDLITAGQAVHWFVFNEFFKEVNRILKSGGILALIGYRLPRIKPQLNQIIDFYYKEILGRYWDQERKHVDNQYRDIPFPYSIIPTPPCCMEVQWSFADLMGYLNTWSALKHFIRINHQNPLDVLHDELLKAWGTQEFNQVRFPLFTRIGRKP